MTVDTGTIIAAAVAFLSIGIALLLVFSMVPATAPFARPLWPTLLTELLIAAVAGVTFWTGGLVLLVALLVTAARVGYEAADVALTRNATRATQSRRTVALGFAAGLATLCLAATLVPLAIAATISLLLFVCGIGILLLRRDRRESDVNALLEVTLFPALPTIMFVAAAVQPANSGLLLALFLLVESYDSYALLGGKLFGRHLAFPRLSPRKTVEGLLAGATGLSITAAVIGVWLFDFSATACVAVALAVGVLSTAGDLAASRLKRISGVKDYPLILPRQGGLFDIVDAWLMSGGFLFAGLALAGLT